MSENMTTILKCWHPAWLISTFCGIGKIPLAPGTFGSLAAFPFIAFLIALSSGMGTIIRHTLLFNYSCNNDCLMAISSAIFIFLIVVMFIVGAWASSVYERYSNTSDPKEIVIDEVVGQSIVLTGCLPIILDAKSMPLKILVCIVLFLLFRFCDILKPWPISWFDKNIEGGLGVMLDDLIAAVMAILLFYSFWFILTDLKVV
jgi:phosphatidylglycerophosphatase A